MATVTLTGHNMGDAATEEDFDSYVAYVCEHIDEACGFTVGVETATPWHSPVSDSGVITDATDEERETIADVLPVLWEVWCAQPLPNNAPDREPNADGWF